MPKPRKPARPSSDKKTASRLDDLVEAFEKKAILNHQYLNDKVVSKTQFHQDMSSLRSKLVGDILKQYEENCYNSTEYYENSVYTAIQQQMKMLEGTNQAFTRMQASLLELQNRNGGNAFDFDFEETESHVNNIAEMWMVRTLMQAMGLGVEADQVVAAIIAREYGAKHQQQGALPNGATELNVKLSAKSSKSITIPVELAVKEKKT